MKAEHRELLLRYLLEEMPAEESRQFDERLLRDEAFGDEMEEARFDLMDACAAGELDSKTSARVQNALPALQEEVAFAVALKKALAKLPAKGTDRQRWRWRGWRWQVAVVTCCLVVAAVFLTFNRKTRPGASPQPISQANSSMGTAAAPQTVTPIPGAEFVLLLSPEILRGESGARPVEIPAGVKSVKCQIVVPDSNGHYTVRVEAGGRTVSSSDRLLPQRLGTASFIEFSLPSDTLPPDTYRFLVSHNINGSDRFSQVYQVQVVAHHAVPASR